MQSESERKECFQLRHVTEQGEELLPSISKVFLIKCSKPQVCCIHISHSVLLLQRMRLAYISVYLCEEGSFMWAIFILVHSFNLNAL